MNSQVPSNVPSPLLLQAQLNQRAVSKMVMYYLCVVFVSYSLDLIGARLVGVRLVVLPFLLQPFRKVHVALILAPHRQSYSSVKSGYFHKLQSAPHTHTF